MICLATLMSVLPECHEEYQRRHDEIWPEMVEQLKVHGVHHYRIFLDAQTSQLFAYVEVENELLWQEMAQTDVCQRWWAMMKDIMPSHADNSPITRDLNCVFYLD